METINLNNGIFQHCFNSEEERAYTKKRLELIESLLKTSGNSVEDFRIALNNASNRIDFISKISNPMNFTLYYILAYLDGYSFDISSFNSVLSKRSERRKKIYDRIINTEFFNSSGTERLYLDNSTYIYLDGINVIQKVIKKLGNYYNLETILNFLATNCICKELIDLVLFKDIDNNFSLKLNNRSCEKVYFINHENEIEFLGDSVRYTTLSFYCYGYEVRVSNCTKQWNDYSEVNNLGTVSEHYLNNVSHDFHFENDEWWINIDYFHDVNSPEEETYLSDYHSGDCPPEVLFDNKTPFRIGFEIEKEDEDILTSLNIEEFKRLTNHQWKKERDGSLDEEGFELISPIFELIPEKIQEHIKDNRTLLNHINADSSYSNCSTHVNVSDNTKSAKELFNSTKFYLPLLYAMYPDRRDNHYCKAKTPESLLYDNEKYQALKIHSNRIEFRIFPRVKNFTQLMFRIRLVSLIMNNQVTSYNEAKKRIECNFKPFLLDSGIYNEVKLSNLLVNMERMAITYKFADIEESDFEDSEF